MRGIRNFFQFLTLLFLIIFISVFFANILGYNYFVMPKTGIHSIIPKNTLIITKDDACANIKDDDIIFILDKNSKLSIDEKEASVVRVIKNDTENKKLVVSSDDLKLNTIEIEYNQYIKSIFFYIHDIDLFISIFEKVKTQFVFFPSICFFMVILCESFIIKQKNDEELDFDCDEKITNIIETNNRHYDNISHLNYTDNEI